jgi:hypothetical protein
MLTVTCMRVNGETIRHTDLENTIILMELNMRVNGKTTNNMARVKRHGPMAHVTKVTIKKERRMGSVSSYGQMDRHTRASS